MSNTPQVIDIRRGQTSASNAAADAACPGRHLAQAGMPDVKSEYAEHGTRIHAALAGMLSPDKLSLDELGTLEAIQQIEQKVFNQYFGASGPVLKTFREQRYWVKFVKPDPTPTSPIREYEHSGQVDVCHKAGVKALLIEYKTLSGEIEESPKNLQLRDQAVLVAGNLIPTDEIAVAVIQPFVTHSPTLCVYDRKALDIATAEVFERVIKSNDPKSKRVAGEVQCKYCRAKASCAEYQAWASKPIAALTKMDFSVPMVQWTPEHWSAFAAALAPCQKFLDDGKDMLKARLEADPKSVPGWQLKPGSMRETIIDPQGVFDRFVKVGGTVQDFMKCVGVTKGKLKEAIAAISDARGKTLDNAVKALTDGLVEAKQTAPSLERVKETP